ncbi:MAG: hypothetical protein HND55_02955 [Pseudomonadota bacterium]|nr:MAG: hypothetical protein HND55_02955 [Pseudomonadota bacterium]
MTQDSNDSNKHESHSTESAGTDTGGGNPIKEMFLLAALYLPLGFFLWFFMASALMFPVGRLAELALVGFYPDLFEQIVQLGFQFEIQTRIIMTQQVEGQTAALNLVINPMIYAWGMALVFGLVMATPLSGRQRLFQIVVGIAVLVPVAAWGVFWEAWRDLAFLMGAEAAAAVRSSGLSPSVIALCYQLGFLVLPGVVPIAAWILMNRAFIEQQVIRQRP